MGLFPSFKKGKVAKQAADDLPKDSINCSASISPAFSSASTLNNMTKFPPTFSGYVKKTKMKTSGLNLGETKESPMYTISLPGGYHGKAHLHSGPDADHDPIIATAKGTGMFLDYSSDIIFPGGITTHFKYDVGTLRYDFDLPVGPESNMEHFRWQVTKATVGGTSMLTRVFDGAVLATLDEGSTGLSLSTAFEFTFEEQAIDGNLGSLFPVMAVFTGIRCWQTRKNIKYSYGAGGGTAMAVAAC